MNNILDLIFTNSPESVSNVSCLSPNTVDLFTDHNLLFFEFQLHLRACSSDERSVLDYRLADWEGLGRTLSSINLSPPTSLAFNNNNSDHAFDN